MEPVEARSFKMMPAKPGTCAFCATKHDENLPHNLQSLFYGTRFKLKYGRDPTWADACAHLTDDQREQWKAAMRKIGVEWTEPQESEPISEPYAESDPFRKDDLS